MLIAHAPSHRLHRSAVQLGEVDIEDGRDHVELDSKGPVAHQEVKGRFMCKAGAEAEIYRASARESKGESS